MCEAKVAQCIHMHAKTERKISLVIVKNHRKLPCPMYFIVLFKAFYVSLPITLQILDAKHYQPHFSDWRHRRKYQPTCPRPQSKEKAPLKQCHVMPTPGLNPARIRY